MDLISSNSGNTLDKTINLKMNLYTAIKNDSIQINYGDSSQNTILLNSCNTFIINNTSLIYYNLK